VPLFRARAGLLLTLCCVVTRLGQGEVEEGKQRAIEEKGPLRNGGLEDGIHRPRVVPVAQRVSKCKSARRRSKLRGAGLASNDAKCENCAYGGATYHHIRPSLTLVRLLLQLDRTQRKH
jgi:hypothetical protein